MGSLKVELLVVNLAVDWESMKVDLMVNLLVVQKGLKKVVKRVAITADKMVATKEYC